MERWLLPLPDGIRRIEGNIRDYPGFKGFVRPSRGQAVEASVLVGGKLYFAHKQRAFVRDSGLCTTGCKRADPTTDCHCVCGSENHGKDFHLNGRHRSTELENEAKRILRGAR